MAVQRARYFGVVLRGDVEGQVEERLAMGFNERGESGRQRLVFVPHELAMD